MRMGQGKTQFSAGGEPTNRERILRAAVAAFGEHGYEGASTNQICADAGISKGLLFHYFKSKENLFMEVLERCRAEVAAAMEPVDASVPEEPLTALNNFYQRQLDFSAATPIITASWSSCLRGIRRCWKSFSARNGRGLKMP